MGVTTTSPTPQGAAVVAATLFGRHHVCDEGVGGGFEVTVVVWGEYGSGGDRGVKMVTGLISVMENDDDGSGALAGKFFRRPENAMEAPDIKEREGRLLPGGVAGIPFSAEVGVEFITNAHAQTTKDHTIVGKEKESLEDLVNRNSVLFSDAFRRSFGMLTCDRLKKLVLNLLMRLSTGWRPKRSLGLCQEKSSKGLKQFDVDGLYLEVPKCWPTSHVMTRFRHLVSDEIHNEVSVNPGRNYVKNSKVSESLLLMKFYLLSYEVVCHLLSGRQVDLPMQVTDEHMDVILFSKSSFIIGRSGTGKTTILTMKLFQNEQRVANDSVGIYEEENYQLREAGVVHDPKNNKPTVLRQLFVTVSPQLCYAVSFTTVDKTAHNSRKFAFTLSPTNYGYWKTMIEPFLITNNLMGYVDGSILFPSKTLFVTDDATVPKENPNYPIWVSNDAHVRMLIIATISEASFRHVQGTTSCDLWLSLEKAYAPHSTSMEYTLETQLLRIEMHGDETPDAYLNRAQEYADALAAIGEPVKDKDLVMLVVSGLREEYNGLKTTITARQSPTTFSELHALLSDHDYMLGKTRAPAPSITSSFAANYVVGSPSMQEAHQAQLSELTTQLSAL
ncbi:nucleotide-binding alpha-beta plait domain-containing protein [Tanacetum coccineum]